MDKRKWTADERDRLASGDIRGAFADPDGQRYPIAGPDDVGDAWGLARTDDIRRAIIRIAKKFGWAGGLPDTAREWARERGIGLRTIMAGSPLKALTSTDDWLVVENHIVLYGGRDLEGEYFTAETDLESDYTRTLGRLPIDFEHGQQVDQVTKGPPPPGRDDILGYTDMSTAVQTEAGTLVQSMLNRHNEYVRMFEPFIEAGMMGTSSEAIPEGVEVEEDGHLRRWPLKRNGLTITPMEPRMKGDNALAAKYKALREQFPGLPEWDAKTAKDTVATDGRPDILPDIQTVQRESNIMSDQDTSPEFATQEDVKSIADQLAAQSEQINQLLEMMAKSPAAKKANLIAPDSTNDHPESKSFADFLYAVQVGNIKRIREVYQTGTDREGTKHIKDLSGNAGTAGAVLVPEEYVQQILQVAEFGSEVMSRVRTIPTARESGKWPALDQYITPTAGSGETALAAGAKLATLEAGGSITEQNIAFTQLQWRLNKVGGFVDVENELIDDSPFAIEALLTSLFGIAHAAKNERNVLRGSGAGEPLGILNWTGLVARVPGTDNSFTYPDAHVMISQFKRITGNAVWLVHPGILPDIYGMESSGGGSVWQANYQVSPQGQLLGYPIFTSEHLPQDDNSGCVILADLGVYLFWQKTTGLAVAYSEHVNFKTDMGCWRFLHRNDGKPWMKDKITLADPQGSFYMSPFVYLND